MNQLRQAMIGAYIKMFKERGNTIQKSRISRYGETAQRGGSKGQTYGKYCMYICTYIYTTPPRAHIHVSETFFAAGSEPMHVCIYVCMYIHNLKLDQHW